MDVHAFSKVCFFHGYFMVNGPWMSMLFPRYAFSMVISIWKRGCSLVSKWWCHFLLVPSKIQNGYTGNYQKWQKSDFSALWSMELCVPLKIEGGSIKIQTRNYSHNVNLCPGVEVMAVYICTYYIDRGLESACRLCNNAGLLMPGNWLELSVNWLELYHGCLMDIVFLWPLMNHGLTKVFPWNNEPCFVHAFSVGGSN